MSSHSSTSVSTISTSVSLSPSPVRPGRNHTGNTQRMTEVDLGRKRRRRSSSMSYTSASSYERPRGNAFREQRPSNAPGMKDDTAVKRSRSRSPFSSQWTKDDRVRVGERGKRRRHASRSPDHTRGRQKEYRSSWDGRRTRSRGSRDRSEATRHRRSMTPVVSPEQYAPERDQYRSAFDRERSFPYARKNQPYAQRHNGPARSHLGSSSHDERPRERSLSPFSKRLAMTQAMNQGR